MAMPLRNQELQAIRTLTRFMPYICISKLLVPNRPLHAFSSPETLESCISLGERALLRVSSFVPSMVIEQMYGIWRGENWRIRSWG